MIKLVNLLKETITEVSVEQLKTQFVDSGKISQKDFEEITNATPKTAYITWLAKKVADKIIKPEDIYKYKKYFGIFDRRKKEYPFTDINQYKTQDDLSQFVSKSVEISDKESEDISQQKGVSKEDKYKEFYIGSVDGFNVYKLPEGRKDLYGASCELGSGTEWCTATGKTREHFDEYISEGPLFIFIKPGDKEKYQFNYETDSFMDKDDIDVTSNKNLYSLFKFIESKYPKYKPPFRLKFYFEPESITIDDYNAGKNLDLTDLPIESLPSGLKVRGDLIIVNSPITSLPDDLTQIGGDLKIANTNISSLPENLKIINGNLSIIDLKSISLPDNLKVKRNMNIIGVKNFPNGLPNGLEVKGSLILKYSAITSLPKDIKVGGGLFLIETPISKKYTSMQLKQMLPGVQGKIHI